MTKALGGATGGAAADNAHIHTVTSRAEPVRALDGGRTTPKIGWTPALHGEIDSARRADHDVERGAGAGRIP